MRHSKQSERATFCQAAILERHGVPWKASLPVFALATLTVKPSECTEHALTRGQKQHSPVDKEMLLKRHTWRCSWMKLCTAAAPVGRHANEAAAAAQRPLAPSWKSVLSLNAGDDHGGSELSHIVPDGLIIRIMNLSLMCAHAHPLSFSLCLPLTHKRHVSVVSLVSTSNKRQARKKHSETDESKVFPWHASLLLIKDGGDLLHQVDCSFLPLNSTTLVNFTDANPDDQLKAASDLKFSESLFLLLYANELNQSVLF